MTEEPEEDSEVEPEQQVAPALKGLAEALHDLVSGLPKIGSMAETTDTDIDSTTSNSDDIIDGGLEPRAGEFAGRDAPEAARDEQGTRHRDTNRDRGRGSLEAHAA